MNSCSFFYFCTWFLRMISFFFADLHVVLNDLVKSKDYSKSVKVDYPFGITNTVLFIKGLYSKISI